VEVRLPQTPARQTAEPDLSHVWLHAMQMADFEREPLIVTGGEGIRLTTREGRVLTDAVSAAMVTSLGYSNAHVVEAMRDQLDRLAFSPILHGTNEPAVALSSRLCELLPGDLDRVFLVSGGSEATETAMKMARQYHQLTGNPRKVKIVSRYLAYHGATSGALAASGLKDKAGADPMGGRVVRVLPPDSYRCPFGQMGPDECAQASLEAIARTIEYEGRDTVAAVIVDPVMAGAGILVPPRNYYARLREICGDDVLLIFDEVLTGFGRTGEWFAADWYGVVPDIICLGKGISAGYSPLAATVARRHVADAFMRRGGHFQHIHTFGGNPLSARVGLAVIDEFERLELVAHARERGVQLLDGLAAMAERVPYIGDVRGLGMLAGVELVADRDSKRPFKRPPAPLAMRAALRDEDLLVRCSRDVVQLAPPLITTEAELEDILVRTERAIVAACREAADLESGASDLG
jgi:adenosylmethionine-8-amino-7-oxononanoate aminotransferase